MTMSSKNNIPKDWEQYSVDEIFDFISTKSLSRAQLTAEGGCYQYLHYGDIHSTFKFPIVDTEVIKLPSIIDNIELNGSIEFLKEGDLIIADASEDLEGVGKCIELKNIKGKKVVGGLHTIVCRDKNERTVNGIRPYLIYNPMVLSQIKRIATGASVLGVSKGNLKNISIPLPSLPEQQKIAEILSTVDEKVENIDQQIAATEQLKKGMMQRLLTKGIGHTEFKDSPLGEIPRSWNIVQVNDISKVIDSLHKTSIFSDTGYPMVRVGDINKPQLNLNNCLKVNEEIFQEFNRNHKPQLGDILMTRVGSFGKSLLVDTNADFCIGQNTVVITNAPNPSFLFYTFNSQNVQKQFSLLTNGSSQPSLSLKDIRILTICFPPKEEQEKISSHLSIIDRKLRIQIEKRVKYIELKKGLMQQLLTGKKRVQL